MAQPIQYTPTPVRTEPTAREELDRLLQSCHEHGVLRFLNDLVSSNTQLAQVLVNELRKETALNTVKNASVLLMALSSIPPEQFYRVVFAIRDSLVILAHQSRESPPQHEAPGVTGAYHMLNDEELWHALTPLVHALKAFASGMQRPIENPISDFSGKPGRPS